jgi:hypothetical protein
VCINIKVTLRLTIRPLRTLFRHLDVCLSYWFSSIAVLLKAVCPHSRTHTHTHTNTVTRYVSSYLRVTKTQKARGVSLFIITQQVEFCSCKSPFSGGLFYIFERSKTLFPFRVTGICSWKGKFQRTWVLSKVDNRRLHYSQGKDFSLSITYRQSRNSRNFLLTEYVGEWHTTLGFKNVWRFAINQSLSCLNRRPAFELFLP